MNPNVSADVARSIIDKNLYLVLGTADAAGRPWASPVWFAPDGYTSFYWVSSPDVTHSQNIAARPEVGIVIFDSSVPIGTGQGVYMRAEARQVTGPELAHGMEVFSRRSLAVGGRAWTVADVEEQGERRLYLATARDHSMLAKDGKPDHRIPINPSA